MASAGRTPTRRPATAQCSLHAIDPSDYRQAEARQQGGQGRAGRRLAPSSDPIARWRCGAYACARKQCKYVETQERRPAVGLSLVDRPAVVAVLSSRVHGRRPRIV